VSTKCMCVCVLVCAHVLWLGFRKRVRWSALMQFASARRDLCVSNMCVCWCVCVCVLVRARVLWLSLMQFARAK
jgi:hypothetical protein